MANEENLMPIEEVNSRRTREQHSKDSRKAGIASGKARREKKLFRETLETLLSMPMKDGKEVPVDKIQNFANIKGQNISVQEAILISQIQKAMKGDTRAAEYVRDTIGQKPSDNVVLNGQVNNPYAGLTTEELKKLIEND